MKAAPFFAKVLKEQLFSELDHATFSEWATSIGVAPSHAYALAQIASLPEEYRDSLQGQNVGLANTKLILPRLQKAIEDDDPEEAEGLIESAASMRWHDLRLDLNGEDQPMQPVPTECPSCGSILELSRAARIESWHRPKKGE